MFILSAEHGLVAPDEWLAPYERYLPRTSPSYREAWGRWVVARLELLRGSLAGTTVEVHASAAYLSAIESPLRAVGAVIHTPLVGLSIGERLHWYAAELASDDRVVSDTPSSEPPLSDVQPLVDELSAFLGDETNALNVPQLLASDRKALQRPGLYSWWVDDRGAHDSPSRSDSRSLRDPSTPVRQVRRDGQAAGARATPCGPDSRACTWARSTSSPPSGGPASLLRPTDSTGRVDKPALTVWMTERLRVVPAPIDDADILGAVEHQLLQILDPP